MTCEDCKYYNPDVVHRCNKYPAIFPIDDAEICGSFKPKGVIVCDRCGKPIKVEGLCYDCEQIIAKQRASGWDSVSK